MNKRSSLFISLVLFVLAATTYAENVSLQTAQIAASSFLRSHGVTSEIHLIDFAEKADFPYFFVFGNEHCLVIISADDCVHPVLGYSMESTFETNGMPINAYGWLKAYNDEIKFSVENRKSPNVEIQSEWNRLLCGNGLEPKTRTSIAPLITTHWNQAEPYNNNCPVDESGPNGHAYSGCIATAMAQVMKYWEHPLRGVGSHSYIPTSHPEYGLQSADFGETIYDWDNMKKHYSIGYSDTEAQAIATLMYHCGVAVNMMYGPDGSSAYLDTSMIALRTYFDYNSSMYREYKSFPYNGGIYTVHDDEEWKGMLKQELNNNRPMIYQGAGVGSHAFVCDGYDEYDYFHFNWGWGGGFDGYYAVNLLNPSNYDYSNSNAAIFGCMPNAPSVNSPNNVNASVDGRNVSISWNSVGSASYYRIYRDGELIANNVHAAYYIDNNVVYGMHSYYVKSVKSDGTMSLKSNTVTVDVHFTGPTPSNLYAFPSNQSVSLTWTTPVPESAVLQYGTGSLVNSCGYGGNSDVYWAQRFPASILSQYAGMAVNKVSVYFKYAGSYTLFLYRGNEISITELIYQRNYSAFAGSWQDINIANPIVVDYTQDLWVVLYTSSSIQYPASYCSYSGNGVENAAYISTSGQSWMLYGDNEYSWLMKTYLTDGTYTYNLYRNGDVVAANLGSSTYTDSNLPDGFYDYHVTTNYFGGESDPSNTVNVMVGNPTYTVNVSAEPSNGGMVSGGGTYNYNQNCTVTAMPNTGYTFLNWTENGNPVSTNASYTFTVTGNRDLVAHFQLQSYTVTATAEPSNGGTVSGGGTYSYGQTCTLTATPSSGYTFVNWTRNGTQVSTNANYTFTVTESAAYVAHFQLQVHTVTVTVNPSNGGTVTGGGTYNHGQTCTVVAAPSNGYTFVNWTENGNVVSSNASYSFTVNNDRTLVANFLLDNYVVSLSAEPANGGNVTGGGAFHYGDNCTVIATGNPGFSFVNWTENGTQVSSNASYSFIVTANRTLVANFTSQNYVITAIAEPSYGGTVSGAGGYNYGETCHLAATANSGYIFLNWTKNGTVVSSYSDYSFTVTETATYVAHFQAQTYTVTVSSNPTEGGTVSGGGTFFYGQTCTVHASANDCYSFTNWTENGNVVSSQADYSFTVTGNRSLVANFTRDTYEVTVEITPECAGIVTGAGTYPCGETCTLTAVPNENYAFMNWTEDGNIITINPMAQFVVTEPHRLEANFIYYDGIGECSLPVEVYPNPANDILTIKGENIQRVMVFNVMGQMVEDREVKGQGKIHIDLSRYESAIYILHIHTEGGWILKRFVKE